MDELIKMVAHRTGLSEQMATLAIEAVLDYLEDKLPSPITTQIRSILGLSDKAQELAGITKGLGGLLGR